MKFKIADKEFDIQPAKTKSVLEIENKIGKSLTKLGEDFSFNDIIDIVTIALTQADPSMTKDWVEENTGIADVETFNKVITYFLAQTK